MVELVATMGGADCEELRAGWLAQPANAVSSLAYAVAGAGVLWRSRRVGGGGAALRAGAGGLIAVGLGSLVYHGPQPAWGSLAHDGAIAWLVLGLAAHFGGLLRSPGGSAFRIRGGGGFGALAGAWGPAAPWLVPAAAAYLAGGTGSAFCDPASLWQPHAAWHTFSAIGLGLALSGGGRCAARGERPG